LHFSLRNKGLKEKFKVKKYLLLIEDERLWKRFKELIKKDLNTEILELIDKKIKEEEKNAK